MASIQVGTLKAHRRLETRMLHVYMHREICTLFYNGQSIILPIPLASLDRP
jgi:hypothetical protein